MREAMLGKEYGVSPGAGFYLDEERLPRGLADFDDLGVHWIRSTIPWKNFQPDDAASYNWKGVDAFCATMNTAQWNGRFQIITTIENPPKWATTPDADVPFDLQAYATAAAALADRMRGTSHVFEIQNSPNIGLKGAPHGDNVVTAWPTPDPKGYAQLLKLVHPAIHAVRERASVLVGGLGGDKNTSTRMAADDFVQALYDNGAQGFFDGVSYHPYSTPFLPCAETDAICTPNLDYVSSKKNPYGMTNGWTRMLNTREIMVANGDESKDIWITEFGAPTGSNKALSEAEQVTILTAGARRAAQYGWVRQFNWFKYQDDPTGENDEVGGDFMGLVRADGSHKPAFDAYKALLH